MPLEGVLQYAIQIADALSAAHSKGVIHRDLKPGNIIVTRSGIKVLDFGVAQMAPAPAGDPENSPTISLATQTGIILGTLHYMSPEQAEGKDADDFAISAARPSRTRPRGPKMPGEKARRPLAIGARSEADARADRSRRARRRIGQYKWGRLSACAGLQPGSKVALAWGGRWSAWSKPCRAKRI